MARAPKKSETLEIRLPYAAKQAFMARCQAEGVSASAALRGYIDGRIAGRSARRWPSWAPLAAAVGLVLGAGIAAPALAGAARPAAFERLDRNRDGLVTRAEYEAASRR